MLANKPGRDTPKNPTKIDLSQFNLVWSDEFDGTELDRAKWDTPHHERHNGCRWRTQYVTVKDGTCRAPAYLKLSVEAAQWCGPTHLWEKDMPEEDVFEIDYVRVYQKR